MSIFVIGMNHKTAPLSLRERMYFSLDKLPLYLQDLLTRGHAAEAVLLSTCNRSELYCETNDIGAVREWFCAQAPANDNEIEPALYIYRDEAAVTHIMHVACGLDSMILGEPQILGQIKAAFSESCAAGTVGGIFHPLFQQVFSVAKEIRATTAIGACPVSVASAAVHFAKQQAGVISDANVVLIGAGDTTELLIRYLQSQLLKPITLINRSIEKARVLVEEEGGYAYGLDMLPEAIASADIVFSATGSAIPILTKQVVATAMQGRQAPLLLIDIAVPRDIEPLVAEVPGVRLYCIDDLKMIIETNRQGREHAADKAREMIGKKSAAFMAELASFDKVSGTIRAYRSQIEDICRAELLKAKHHMHQGVNPTQVLEMFAYAFTQKLLHAPSVQLRQAGAEGRFELLNFAKQLFAISDSDLEVERL